MIGIQLADALDGIRIVELTMVIFGPWARQKLGDKGADVVEIETPSSVRRL